MLLLPAEIDDEQLVAQPQSGVIGLECHRHRADNRDLEPIQLAINPAINELIPAKYRGRVDRPRPSTRLAACLRSGCCPCHWCVPGPPQRPGEPPLAVHPRPRGEGAQIVRDIDKTVVEETGKDLPTVSETITIRQAQVDRYRPDRPDDLHPLPAAHDPVLSPLFDTVGRVKMIAGTYILSGALLGLVGFFLGSVTAVSLTLFGAIIFFFASAGASAAYLTASEIFPMETRALCIASSTRSALPSEGSPGPCCSEV